MNLKWSAMMSKYRCITYDDIEMVGYTPTWFGEELPSYVELICFKCNKTYSRDIIRLVRPDVQEHCICGEHMPQMKYIEEVKE